MANITSEHVTKRYADGFEAVTDMNLGIADGEFMVLVGPSGSEKSTALRMVAGLEEITDGVLKIGDEVVNDLSTKDRDVAMVFQNYALYPHMTVRQNMGFVLKLQGTPRKDIDRRVDEAATILDIRAISTASPRTSQVASASGLRWDARSSATRRRFSWTSPSRTSTPS